MFEIFPKHDLHLNKAPLRLVPGDFESFHLDTVGVPRSWGLQVTGIFLQFCNNTLPDAIFISLNLFVWTSPLWSFVSQIKRTLCASNDFSYNIGFLRFMNDISVFINVALSWTTTRKECSAWRRYSTKDESSHILRLLTMKLTQSPHHILFNRLKKRPPAQDKAILVNSEVILNMKFLAIYYSIKPEFTNLRASRKSFQRFP